MLLLPRRLVEVTIRRRSSQVRRIVASARQREGLLAASDAQRTPSFVLV
jgi:regulator of extracellular matrix RemA (YlzA/DUF370 family)